MVNLRQLLATSRSLIGIRAAPAPLKMVEQDFLPRFGTLASRLDGKSSAQGTGSDAASPFEAAPHPRQEAEKEPGEEPRKEAEVTPDAEPVPPVQADSAPPAPQAPEAVSPPIARAGRMEKGGSRFDFFSLRRPRPVRQEPCQIEMALGRVKVMRNDLRDADLELVEPRRGWTSEQAGSGWKRLAAALAPAGRALPARTDGRKPNALAASELVGVGRNEA